ncbi:uncharacterized protein LOC144411712 [Styela clava]
MKIKTLFVVLLFKGFIRSSISQCDGSQMIISNGTGHIQSPNYLNEYGKKASCTWKFVPEDNDKFIQLILTVEYQRLYFVDRIYKVCSGSYILTINNETADCDRYIDSIYTPAINMTYHQPQHCIGTSDGKLMPYVEVRYVSDGRTANYSASSMGFRIHYNYTRCTQGTREITASSTYIQTTLKHATEQFNKSELLFTTSVSQPVRTESSTQSTTIIILIFVIILLLVLVGAIVIYFRKRLRTTVAEQQEPTSINITTPDAGRSSPSAQPNPTYEEISDKKYENLQTPIEEDPYLQPFEMGNAGYEATTPRRQY